MVPWKGQHPQLQMVAAPTLQPKNALAYSNSLYSCKSRWIHASVQQLCLTDKIGVALQTTRQLLTNKDNSTSSSRAPSKGIARSLAHCRWPMTLLWPKRSLGTCADSEYQFIDTQKVIHRRSVATKKATKPLNIAKSKTFRLYRRMSADDVPADLHNICLTRYHHWRWNHHAIVHNCQRRHGISS